MCWVLARGLGVRSGCGRCVWGAFSSRRDPQTTDGHEDTVQGLLLHLLGTHHSSAVALSTHGAPRALPSLGDPLGGVQGLPLPLSGAGACPRWSPCLRLSAIPRRVDHAVSLFLSEGLRGVPLSSRCDWRSFDRFARVHKGGRVSAWPRSRFALIRKLPDRVPPAATRVPASPHPASAGPCPSDRGVRGGGAVPRGCALRFPWPGRSRVVLRAHGAAACLLGGACLLLFACCSAGSFLSLLSPALCAGAGCESAPFSLLGLGGQCHL